MTRRLQPSTAPAQETDGHGDVPSQLGDPLSPYLLTDEAARYLRFNSAHLFRKWAARNRVPVLRRGRGLLYDRRVLDAFVNGEKWTEGRNHDAKVAPALAVVKPTDREYTRGGR